MIWGAGSLVQSGWDDFSYLAPRVAIAALVAFLFAKPLSLLELSEQGAKSLGVSLAKLRFVCLGLAVLITSWVVATVGIIGFIGLAAPAITRLIGVHKIQHKLWISMLIGAMLLTLTDLVIQQLPGLMASFIPNRSCHCRVRRTTVTLVTTSIITKDARAYANCAHSSLGARQQT